MQRQLGVRIESAFSRKLNKMMNMTKSIEKNSACGRQKIF